MLASRTIHRAELSGTRAVRRATRLAVVVVGLALAAPATGQTLSGHVLEEGTGSPVDAVLIELLRADSTVIRGTLSANGGRYALRVDTTGTFLIRLDRLGYRATMIGPIAIARDSSLDMQLPLQPVAIAPIQATGEGRCSVRPEEGLATARLWEQIRKALAVADVVRKEALLEFDLLRFERELTPDRSAQQVEILEAWTGSDPFRGFPGEVLARDGFIQQADAGNIYWYMPDADVIMSNAFLDSHCFSVVDRFDGDRRLLGLAFQPVERRRDRPDRDEMTPVFRELVGDDPADVHGALWVDATTGALETLEYGYTGIRAKELTAMAGGYARFEQLADGTWVVRQWWIRMPRFASRSRRGGRLSANGIRETGGEVIEARDAAGRLATRRAGQPVRGHLALSDLGVPLDSMTVVRLSGTAYLAHVAADGSFVIPDVVPGRYLAIFHHPVLDTLAIDLPVQNFNVSHESVDLELTMPSRRKALSSICPRMDEDSRNGVLVVSLTRGVEPIGGRPVRVRSAQTGLPVGEAMTRDDGMIRFCDVPADQALEIIVPGRSELRESVVVPAGGFARRDIAIPTSPTR